MIGLEFREDLEFKITVIMAVFIKNRLLELGM